MALHRPEAGRGGLTADGHPPAGDDPPAPSPRGIDRAIRLSTAAAVLAVGGIAAYVSYWHAYAVIRAHGETGITARLEPATIDGLVYASSMVVLYAARHRVPVPCLARWLLALGIAATLTANMAQGWSHGLVGAVIAAWPAVSLVGSYELLVWLIRTCGTADRAGSRAEPPGCPNTFQYSDFDRHHRGVAVRGPPLPGASPLSGRPDSPRKVSSDSAPSRSTPRDGVPDRRRPGAVVGIGRGTTGGIVVFDVDDTGQRGEHRVTDRRTAGIGRR